MAAAAAAAPQQALEQAMQRNELAKLPIWFGDPAKDAFRPEDWWQRFELAAAAAAWNWDQIRTFFMQALRGNALTWWNWLSKNAPVADINGLRAAFLNDYGRTAVARASITQLKLLQKPKQLVRDYCSDLQVKIDELELAVAPRPVLNANQILQNRPAAVAAIAAAELPWLQAQYARIYDEGYNAFKQPFIRNLIIDGLLPPIRDEVLRANPATVLETITIAKQAEKDLELKSSISKTNGSVDELEDLNAIQNRRRQFPPPRGGTSNRGRPRPPSQPSREVPTCYYCNKRGHVQKDCYKRQRENGAYKQPPKSSVHGVDQEQQPQQDLPPPNEPQTPQEHYVDLAALQAMQALNW